MSMDFRPNAPTGSLRSRFRLLNPFIIANPLVRRLVLVALTSVVTLVVMTSHREQPNFAEMSNGAQPLAPGQLPLDFLYNIPRGQLDPHAPVEFASRWSFLAHSMADYANHAWAGKYVRVSAVGGGIDVLIVTPKGYAAVLDAREDGVVAHHYPMGTLQALNDRIELTPEKNTALPPLPAPLYAAHWGERHYLLSETEVKQQAAALAKTGQADTAALERAFIRAGEQAAPTPGSLVLPANVAGN